MIFIFIFFIAFLQLYISQFLNIQYQFSLMDKGEHKIVVITLFTGVDFLEVIFFKNIISLTFIILEIIIDGIKAYKSSPLSI